jgi:hypothetical protein
MSISRFGFVAVCHAILVIAGASMAGASVLTVVVTTPLSVTVDDKFCDSFSLTGTAPDQTLVCNSSLPAPVLVSAVSRKIHGAAGTFDLPLSLVPTTPTVEPRVGPTHTIVMTFDKPVVAATAQVTEGNATTGAATFSGNTVTAPLAFVANQQYATLSLTGVTAAGGGNAGSASVRIGFLVGDTSQNRVVSVADAAAINVHLSQPVTVGNFLLDLNANGALTIADKAIANVNLTKALPPP